MSLTEGVLLLAVLAAGAVLAWYYRLENLLKGYQGDGDIALLRGWRLALPDLALTLPLKAGERLYRLDGLPPDRIYTPMLVLASGAAAPGRLRLEAQRGGQIINVADSAAAGWQTAGPGVYRLGGQASFAVRRDDRWTLRCCWEQEAAPSAALVLTSRGPA